MANEYYGAPTTPTSDYLAHYGIKGMKWGVRKARESGNMRAMDRQYRKAQKKLAKLERQAASGKKYAKRAAALGAGAAAAGGLAALGTKGIVDVMGGATRGVQGAGKALMGVRGNSQVAHRLRNVGVALNRTASAGGGLTNKMGGAASSITKWGNSTSLAKRGVDALGGVERGAQNLSKTLMNTRGSNAIAKSMRDAGVNLGRSSTPALGNAAKNLRGVSNNTIARIGAGALGAGLGIGAGYNAYRAATTKKAAAKAAAFRNEMNKQFAGYSPNGGSKKRRRR